MTCVVGVLSWLPVPRKETATPGGFAKQQNLFDPFWVKERHYYS